MSIRGLALVCLIIAGSPALAPCQDKAPLGLAFTEGLSIERETGESGALVVREMLKASRARLSGSADLSSSIGLAAGDEGSFIDSAGTHFEYRFLELDSVGLYLDSHLRYRELFADAWELRLGATLGGRWGRDGDSRRLFGDWELGFEGIRSAIAENAIILWQGNPMLRFGAGWRFSRVLAVDAAIESFSDEDASYFPKLMFDLGSSLQFVGCSLRGDFVLKYTDFATPTGNIDGYAFRAAVTIPLEEG